jgi:hypothetical protein
MVNALVPRDLAARASRVGDLLTTHFVRRWPKRRALTAVGALATGLGVFGVLALGLPSTPQSQTLSALSPALETAGVALFEPLTFADRFAADVKDLPPTVGVSASLSDDPRAARLAAYGAALEGRSRESVPAEGAEVIPPAQPRAPSETTGARP